MSGLDFCLRAIGLWAPGYPDLSAWRGRPADCPQDQGAIPRAELLPPMMRRRTSLLTRMVAEVVVQATRDWPGLARERPALDLARIPLVYGSVYGEIRTTVDLLAALLVPGEPLSPTKFHNSVHNTAAGYISIATGNRVGDSVLAAGRSTPAMALLEGVTLVHTRGGDAIVVVAEEPLPEPLAAGRRYGPFAVAFAISAPDCSDSYARRCRLVRGSSADGPALRPLPAWLADSPCAAALLAADALAEPAAGRVALEPHLPSGWLCEFGPFPS
ncbi:MAG TPA: beta-ketoacyl synthase chain length factor [Nannocystis sp.]